jgi:hypothetical protein
VSAEQTDHADHAGPDPGYHYQDVECTICGRHNRDVHLVAAGDDLRICQVCVARCAEVIDADAGLAPPTVPWSERWALKSAAG